ncbi:MAG: RHS repeat protein, partial [Deltaproteobacteria bacterium]|nr:RHS repeat protein [Deltaproteobacteria bacterium]
MRREDHRLETFTDAKGFERIYEYDEKDRLTAVHLNDPESLPPVEAFNYNALNDYTFAQSIGSGLVQMFYSYDGKGRLDEYTEYALPYKFKYHFNNNGEVDGLKIKNVQDNALAFEFSFSYNQNGRLSQVKDVLMDETLVNIISDPIANFITRLFGNNLTETFYLNNDGSVEWIEK